MSEDLDLTFPAHIAEVQRRCDGALERAGLDGVAVYSGRPGLHFLDDHGPPFKANPHFLHWAPLLEAPDCFVRYLPGRRPELIFHQPADYWHKPPDLPAGDWTRQFEIVVIREPAAARALLEAGKPRLAFVGEPAPEHRAWQAFAAFNPPALLDYLHYYRATKTPYELGCMREAARLGALGHLAAAAAYRAGASEFEVHQAYCSAAGLREQELPYGNIVAFGAGASILHYTALGRGRDVPRPSFLIDAGAQCRGYASDITRTYVATGADPQFVELLTAVEKLQREICAAVRPGTDYRDLHLMAHRLIAEALIRSGVVVDCDAEGAVQHGVTSVFFPHGIGHLLGLQVHDVAGLAADDAGSAEIPRPAGHPYLRLTRRLEPGFVVTIEPGIYFIDLLLDEARKSPANRHIHWDTVRRLQPYGGIRIEDDVACTDGEVPENLSRDAFAQINQ
jgi:Xaa-Pro dipeptidase